MRGFTLIEVLVTLCIIMIFFVGISKIAVLSTRSCRYSDDLTYAAALAHSKLLGFKVLEMDSQEMSVAWHQDPDNPIDWHNKKFYRFWQVSAVPLGKEVKMYIAWDEPHRETLREFTSLAELKDSKCPCIDFTDVFLTE